MSCTPAYNRLQQIFCLNWLSNAVMGKSGAQEELQALAAQVVTQTLADPQTVGFIGQWDLVWGPVVFQHEPQDQASQMFDSVADNTMFVAARTVGAITTYTVAIAGTNPTSWYGWFFEDFAVYKTVAWSDALAGNFSGEHTDDDSMARISQGTANGIAALLNMTDGQKGTLANFLAGVVATPGGGGIEVAVSGHSLGGALSATLALYFADTQGVANNWDPNRRAMVTAMPSAGATPGNAVFAMHYDEVLGTHTNRIWNALDIVPHAWELDMLNQASHLYYPYIVPNGLVLGLVALATAGSIGSEQAYLQLNHQTAPLASQVSITEAVATINPAKIGIDLVAGFIASKLAKQFGWSEAVTKAVADLIEAIIENHLSKSAETLSKKDSVLPGFHPLSALNEAVKKVEDDLAAAVAEIGDSKIVQSLADLLRFLGQAGYQHVTAYVLLLEITGFAQVMSKYTDEG